MEAGLDTCPHCGQKVLKGAMKCVGCSRTLKSPEEQLAAIQEFKKSKKSFDLRGFLRLVIMLVSISIIYYFFSDRIISFIRNIAGK